MVEKNIDDIIDEAWYEAERENDKKAIRILEKAMMEFPQEKDLILLQLAQIYFRERQDLKALEIFQICYNNSTDEEVLSFLLSCYNEPNVKEYTTRYACNSDVLENYKYFFGKIEDVKHIKEKILWENENQLIYYSDINKQICSMNAALVNNDFKNKIVMLVNQWDINKILDYERTTKQELNYLTAEVPMYLYYDEDIFSMVIQTIEFTEIIKKNRIVIMVGKVQLEKFFDDIQVIFPNYVIGDDVNEYTDMIQKKSKKHYDYLNKCKNDVEEYYRKNSLEILNNIKCGKPKILFRTTRFSSVLQYHARDCMEAAQQLGLETRMVIEKSDIHRVTELDDFDAINKLKPDIIFCLNHFRFEDPQLPKDIVWITWIQDPMEHIMDKNTPGKLLDRDFVLNHIYGWPEFKKLNYFKERMFQAPVPANHNKYKPYIISEEEKEKYSCDICFVCHAADFEQYLSRYLNTIGDFTVRNYLEKLSCEYYEFVNVTGKMCYSKEQFKEFFLKLLKKWNYEIHEDIFNSFIEQFYLWINQRIFRQILVNWLIDAGYDNIKLWGNGWVKHEKYKKYAMGPAQNGEQLSKIYQCSKINVGNNIVTTAAARAWESMLSGGFYISNYIPEENDISDIRNIFKVDEFVMFYDKEDFLAKIKYYLEHEDKRLEMLKIGRKCALERMTFEALMKKIIKNVGNYYKKGN